MMFGRRRWLIALSGAAMLAAACGGTTPTATAQPTLRAVQPTPSGATVQATITTAAGGALASSDGRLKLAFPPGAVASDVTVSVTPMSLTGDTSGGAAFYTLGPDGAHFARPVAVTYTRSNLDVSKRAPMLVGWTASRGGAEQLGEGASEVNLSTGVAVLTGTLTHFTDFYADAAYVEAGPKEVTAFVDDPAWTLSVKISNYQHDGVFNYIATNSEFRITDMTYPSVNPPVGRPGLISHPNFTVPFETSSDLSSGPPTFNCLAPGVGTYGVSYRVEMTAPFYVKDSAGGGSWETFSVTTRQKVTGLAQCMRRPTMTGTLSPPSTLFVIEPSGDAYTWIDPIGCGTFTSGGIGATWTHPNAPDPSKAKDDTDGDGIPDYCPHTEVQNFSHPGHVSVLISNGLGGYAWCREEGSLSGTGVCHPGKPPKAEGFPADVSEPT